MWLAQRNKIDYSSDDYLLITLQWQAIKMSISSRQTGVTQNHEHRHDGTSTLKVTHSGETFIRIYFVTSVLDAKFQRRRFKCIYVFLMNINYYYQWQLKIGVQFSIMIKHLNMDNSNVVLWGVNGAWGIKEILLHLNSQYIGFTVYVTCTAYVVVCRILEIKMWPLSFSVSSWERCAHLIEWLTEFSSCSCQLNVCALSDECKLKWSTRLSLFQNTTKYLPLFINKRKLNTYGICGKDALRKVRPFIVYLNYSTVVWNLWKRAVLSFIKLTQV